MENEEENHPLTPEELKQISSTISILPELSKEQYEKVFSKYVEFLQKYQRTPQETTTNILLSYISILSNLDYSLKNFFYLKNYFT